MIISLVCKESTHIEKELLRVNFDKSCLPQDHCYQQFLNVSPDTDVNKFLHRMQAPPIEGNREQGQVPTVSDPRSLWEGASSQFRGSDWPR